MPPAHRTSSVSEDRNGISAKPRLEIFPSPTKGILLTPGTGAARRKSVSFGILANSRPNGGQEQAQRVGGLSVSSEDVPNALIPNEPRAKDHGSASLSRTLFKSKLEVADQLHGAEQVPVRAAQIPQEIRTSDSTKAQSQDGQGIECTDGDITIDLDTPRSKSGKHWKAEYERYSKRSDREMKKVIQLSQTAKSYAAKKDVEAANLGEMLSEELSRTAEMEAKVSAVASQLAKHAAQGLGVSPDEQKLISDLAKQTALALRYKHKADRCRTALNRQSRPTGMSYDGDTVAVHSTESEDTIVKVSTEDGQDWFSLGIDLRDMKERAQNAELKAAGLEKENSALKANLARVKGEIDKYEARRKGREGNQQKREAKLKSQSDEYKVQITQLTTENQSLRHGATLKVDGSVPNPPTRPLPQLLSAPDSNDRNKILECPQLTEMNGPGLQGHLQNSDRLKTKVEEHVEALRSQESTRRITDFPSEDQPPMKMFAKHDNLTVYRVEDPRGSSRSPRRRALKPTLDIWTMDDEQDTPETGVAGPQVLPDDSSNEAGIVKLSKETDDALREISRNVMEEQQNSSEKILNRSPDKIPVPTDPNRYLETVSPKISALENPKTGTRSAIRWMHERKSTINSPRPSMLSFIASPKKNPDPDQPLAGLNLTDLRSTSNIANSLRRKTGTISASTRTSSTARIRPHTGLTDDRIHAAKLRLANKRKLQENQKPEA